MKVLERTDNSLGNLQTHIYIYVIMCVYCAWFLHQPLSWCRSSLSKCHLMTDQILAADRSYKEPLQNTCKDEYEYKCQCTYNYTYEYTCTGT